MAERPAYIPEDISDDAVDFMRRCGVIRDDGSIDAAQVCREMSDFHMVIEECSKVYYHVTGGVLSKPLSAAEHVIRFCEEREEKETADAVAEETLEIRGELEELRALINSPQVDNFLEAVRTEAAHQVERWGTDHDTGKTDAEWLWLCGWLVSKAVHATTLEKKLHHLITTAAALLNWHGHLQGVRTRMRPGIEPPAEKGASSDG